MRMPLLIYPTIFFLLTTSSHVIAENAPVRTSNANAGQYCPDKETASVMLEELSLAFAEVARADREIVGRNTEKAIQHGTRAAMALSLASSRGNAARTAQLIDAVINTKASEDNKEILTRFSILRSALLALPENVYTNAATNSISTAESILEGDNQGNALEQLRTAQHWLSCDKYALPTNQAADALSRINEALSLGKLPDSTQFDEVYAPLLQVIGVTIEWSH